MTANTLRAELENDTDTFEPSRINNIDYTKKNISHDLRFAQYLYDYLKQTTSVNTFGYDDREINVADSDMLYGTPEKLGGDAQNIYNIVKICCIIVNNTAF